MGIGQHLTWVFAVESVQSGWCGLLEEAGLSAFDQGHWVPGRQAVEQVWDDRWKEGQ